MLKRFFIICLALFISSDQARTNNYDKVRHLHISWNEVLAIKYERYDVYFYSKACQHCEKLRELVIAKAMNTNFIRLFFIEVNYDIPFGYVTNPNECICELSKLVLQAYPSILMIENNCMNGRIVGYQALVDYLEMGTVQDDAQLE